MEKWVAKLQLFARLRIDSVSKVFNTLKTLFQQRGNFQRKCIYPEGVNSTKGINYSTFKTQELCLVAEKIHIS